MPTGYTFNIVEGISFKEYVLQCARAFGACITMKDEPFDEPIPEKFEESDYYKNKIEDLKKELSKLLKMSNKQLQKEIDRKYEEQIKNNKEQIKKHLELKEKYEKMLEKVRKWNPPTKDHTGLKRFMEEQILQSIEFDCDVSYYKGKSIIKLNVDQYRYENKKELEKDIDYYMKRWKDETKRVQERNNWIRQLRDSLEE